MELSASPNLDWSHLALDSSIVTKWSARTDNPAYLSTLIWSADLKTC